MIRAICRLAGFVVVFCSAFVAVMPAQTPPAQQPPRPPPPAGQQPPASPLQGPTFRARIDSVSVDVIVTDKQGKPVTDLKAEDFEIRESNKPQTVETFRMVKLDEPAVDEPTTSHAIRSISDQYAQTGRDDTRLFVIFLDDYHVRRLNGMRVRQQVSQFIQQQLGPRDLVAVMYPLQQLTGLTFSQDHDGTAQAVLAFDGRKYDYTPKNAYEDRLTNEPPEVIERIRNDIVISALKGLCIHLGTVRSGRKSVLFVSEGFVSRVPPGVRTTGSMPRIGTSAMTVLDERLADLGAFDVLNQLRDVFTAAARSNTSLYTLDPRGLAPSEFGPQDNVNPDVDRRTLSDTMDTLRTIADQTDGRAIVGRNDPLADLAQMVKDSTVYYLLGYTPSPAPRDGRFHAIQVKVKRKDVEVRARKGYWAYTAEEIARATAVPTAKVGPPPDVQEALDTLSESTRGRAVRVWLAAERGTGPKAKVTLAWEANPQQAGEGVVDHITVTASSIYGDLLFKGPVPRDPQRPKASGQMTFEAPAGAVHVQLLAEDAKGQRLDHGDEAIDVPDFTSVGPLVTTPFVFRARTARDVQVLRAAQSPMPAVGRDFLRTERLLLRFQAYGPAGTAPVLSARLLNQLGQSMAALPAPTKNAAGAYELELGLGPLQPGDYVIEITAESDSSKAKALVAIRITG